MVGIHARLWEFLVTVSCQKSKTTNCDHQKIVIFATYFWPTIQGFFETTKFLVKLIKWPCTFVRIKNLYFSTFYHRFVFHQFTSTKLDNKVLFQLENFDVSEFLCHEAALEGGSHVYDLQSAVCHFGGEFAFMIWVCCWNPLIVQYKSSFICDIKDGGWSIALHLECIKGICSDCNNIIFMTWIKRYQQKKPIYKFQSYFTLTS